MSNVVLLIQAVVRKEAIASFIEVVASTIVEATKEPFCISINFYQDSENPSFFTIHEVWESKEYLLSDDHKKTPHVISFFENTEEMLAQSLQYSVLNIISETKGLNRKA